MNKLKAFGIAVLPLCCVLLYCTWNYSRTGKFHFSSIEEINAGVNCQLYISAKEGVVKANHVHDSLREKIAAIPIYKDRYNFAIHASKEYLKDHLVSYTLFHLTQTARFFVEPGKAEIDLFTGLLTNTVLGEAKPANSGFYATIHEKGWKGIGEYARRSPSMPFVIVILLFNCLKMLGFILFMATKKINFGIRAFVFVLIGYFAITVGPVANTHYFLPVSLIMAGAATIGFGQWMERRKLSI